MASVPLHMLEVLSICIRLNAYLINERVRPSFDIHMKIIWWVIIMDFI